MIRAAPFLAAALTSALVTGAAQAQDRHWSVLEFEAGQLGNYDMDTVLSAGTALCILHSADPETFTSELDRRGFSVDQGEIGGEAVIEAFRGESWITLWYAPDIQTCIVEVDRAKGPDSDQAVGEMLTRAAWPGWAWAADGGCSSFTLPGGPDIHIDSGGQDPNCDTMESSAISVVSIAGQAGTATDNKMAAADQPHTSVSGEQAVDLFRAICLENAPDFSDAKAAARFRGFNQDGDDGALLHGSSAVSFKRVVQEGEFDTACSLLFETEESDHGVMSLLLEDAKAFLPADAEFDISEESLRAVARWGDGGFWLGMGHEAQSERALMQVMIGRLR